MAALSRLVSTIDHTFRRTWVDVFESEAYALSSPCTLIYPTTLTLLVYGLGLSLRAVLSVPRHSPTSTGNPHPEKTSPALGRYQSCYLIQMVTQMICCGLIRSPLLDLEWSMAPEPRRPAAVPVTVPSRILILVFFLGLAPSNLPPSVVTPENNHQPVVEGTNEIIQMVLTAFLILDSTP